MIRLPELAAAIAVKHNISQREAEQFVMTMVDVMNDALRETKQLRVKGLGTFKVSTVNARESVDVNTGERITIDGRERLTFTPEPSMRDLVNKPFAQFETVVINDGVDFEEIDRKYQHDVPEEEPEREDAAVVAEPSIKVAEPSTKTETDTEETMKAKDKEQPQQKLDKYGYPINAVEYEELEDTIARKTNVIRWLVAAIVCLLLVTLGGAYYFQQEIKERDNRISHLVAQIQEDQSNKAIHSTGRSRHAGTSADRHVRQAMSERERVENEMAEHERRVKEQQAAMASEAKKREEDVKKAQEQRRVEEARQEELMKKEQERRKIAEAEQKKQLEAKRAELARKAEQAKQEEAARKAEQARQAAAKQQAAKQQATATSQGAAKWNDDPRVRTGAYTITGVSETVTVREGQTLAGISKAYLGPGMECYVEAINGGIKEVKAGQKIKIPALKVKTSAKAKK